jgi:chemotaxis signal transduction protein
MEMQLPSGVEDLLTPDEPVPEVPHATAYLLEYSQGHYFAFPAHTGVELVEQPRVVAVPGMPYFCLGLMAWQRRQLPLLDLAKLVAGPLPQGNGNPSIGHVLVLAYQTARGKALEYGAVCAPSLISKLEVIDSQQCELPKDSDLLPRIALSCFEYEGQAVPILDSASLFARPDK